MNGLISRAAVVLSCLAPAVLQAAVPGLIKFQTRLADSAGSPLSGAQTLTFRIFNASTSGTQLASGTAAGTATNGLISLDLPASAGAFTTPDSFLELELGGQALSPRSRLGAVPYAFHAADSDETVVLTYRLLGIGVARSDVDGGAIAPFSGKIQSVGLFRRVAGTSGSTIVDLRREGSTVFTNSANRPSLAFNAAANRTLATTIDLPSVTSGDLLSCDVAQVEGGNPEDIVVAVLLKKD